MSKDNFKNVIFNLKEINSRTHENSTEQKEEKFLNPGAI